MPILLHWISGRTLQQLQIICSSKRKYNLEGWRKQSSPRGVESSTAKSHTINRTCYLIYLIFKGDTNYEAIFSYASFHSHYTPGTNHYFDKTALLMLPAGTHTLLEAVFISSSYYKAGEFSPERLNSGPDLPSCYVVIMPLKSKELLKDSLLL